MAPIGSEGVRRVVITGIGLVTGLGTGTDETWDGAPRRPERASGRSRATTRRRCARSSAVEVDDFDPGEFANRKTLRSMTRNDQLAIAGATLALRDAGIEQVEEGERAGLFVARRQGDLEPDAHPRGVDSARASTDGTVDIRASRRAGVVGLLSALLRRGPAGGSLFYVSQAYGLKGANTYFAGGAEAGANGARARAFRAVRRGEVDIAVAGGFDDACSMVEHDQVRRARSPRRRKRARHAGVPALRPPADRDGARRGRGVRSCSRTPTARPRAACTSTRRSPGSAAATTRNSLITPHPAARGPRPRDHRGAARGGRGAGRGVDYVAAHGSGTRARRRDARPARSARSSAAGAACSRAASSRRPATSSAAPARSTPPSPRSPSSRGAVPPTLDLDELDPACDGPDWVTGAAREAQVGLALALARGLEGTERRPRPTRALSALNGGASVVRHPGTAPRRRHRHRRDHRPGRHARQQFWDGVSAGRVAIRPVQHLPMEGYRTTLGGEVPSTRSPEHEYRRPDDYREPVIDFALQGGRGGRRALRRPARRRDRPGALGRRRRHLQRGPARRRASGTSAG